MPRTALMSLRLIEQIRELLDKESDDARLAERLGLGLEAVPRHRPAAGTRGRSGLIQKSADVIRQRGADKVPLRDLALGRRQVSAVTITLATNASPPASATGVPVQTATIGTIAGTALTHSSQYIVTGLFSIPANQSAGTEDVAVSFSLASPGCGEDDPGVAWAGGC